MVHVDLALPTRAHLLAVLEVVPRHSLDGVVFEGLYAVAGGVLVGVGDFVQVDRKVDFLSIHYLLWQS